MASPNESDEFPILSIPEAESRAHTRPFTSRNRSVSLSSHPTFSTDRIDSSNVVLGHTAPLLTQRIRPPLVEMTGPLYSARRPESLSPPSTNEPSDFSFVVDPPPEDDDLGLRNANLLRSGQLGLCNDPYCTTCPSYCKIQAGQFRTSIFSSSRFHTALYGDARGWARRFTSSFHRCLLGIMNPHSKFVQEWTKFVAFSSIVAIFIDPLFLFLLLIRDDNKCIDIDWGMTRVLVSLRSITDLLFSINILLQFRLAYVAPESRIVGAGQLVDHPRKIARNYFRGKFVLDLFILLPIPQVMILWIIPSHLGTARKESEKHILSIALCQYIPKLYRLLPLLSGPTPTGFIFELAWVNFSIKLLTFMFAGHAVGSSWYLFGLQRVRQCLLNAWNTSVDERRNLMDCARRSYAPESLRALWRNNDSVNACFQENISFYGIYSKAVNLTNQSNFITRYNYSLFWGFQQISTLAGNLIPTYSEGEVFFTMCIIGLGLLLFAQNILQALERGRMEMMLRRRDLERWMSRRLLPEDIRKRVREAERFNWAATRGVNEDFLFENIPEDLQRDIKRHLFKFLNKVRIFSLMDESVLDAIRERLKQRTYIRNSTVLHRGGLVDKMVFIVKGAMESIGEDGSVLPLSEGDVFGEELLTWCLERSSVNPDGTRTKMGLVSNRNVSCVTNVEAFSLSVADLEDVTNLFSRFLRNHRMQAAIRYESPYWRLRAAVQIQVAWRYRRRRLQRSYAAQSSSSR